MGSILDRLWRAFTLIELLVVVAIVAILAAISAGVTIGLIQGLLFAKVGSPAIPRFRNRLALVRVFDLQSRAFCGIECLGHLDGGEPQSALRHQTVDPPREVDITADQRLVAFREKLLKFKTHVSGKLKLG